MGNYSSYSQLNSLEEVSFIAGTPYIFYFVAYEEDGVTRKDLTGITPIWVMSYFDDTSVAVLQKTSTVTDALQGEFKVSLTTPDTITLDGKFIHQPVIGASPAAYRLAQGTILILPAIPTA